MLSSAARSSWARNSRRGTHGANERRFRGGRDRRRGGGSHAGHRCRRGAARRRRSRHPQPGAGSRWAAAGRNHAGAHANLWRLRQEGVNFLNGHAVFPTVTRVNATAIATGTYPARNGILGNRIYVRAVNPNLAFVNDDHRNLLKLDEVTGGNMVLTKSLGEILAERGKRLAAVSSGSTGQALLLNPRAPKGVGVT